MPSTNYNLTGQLLDYSEIKNLESNQHDPTRRDQQLSTNLEAVSTFMCYPCTHGDVNILYIIIAQVHVATDGIFVNGTHMAFLTNAYSTRDSTTEQQDIPKDCTTTKDLIKTDPTAL